MNERDEQRREAIAQYQFKDEAWDHASDEQREAFFALCAQVVGTPRHTIERAALTHRIGELVADIYTSLADALIEQDKLDEGTEDYSDEPTERELFERNEVRSGHGRIFVDLCFISGINAFAG